MAKPVAIFDGVCNFCNGAITFIIKRDPDEVFLFAPSQGETGKSLLEQYGLVEEAIESVVLIRDGQVFTRSDAALEILRGLKTIWKCLLIFKIVPRPIRDSVYGYLARNRYRFFGKMDACIRPSPELRNRFLD